MNRWGILCGVTCVLNLTFFVFVDSDIRYLNLGAGIISGLGFIAAAILATR